MFFHKNKKILRLEKKIRKQTTNNKIFVLFALGYFE